jgi:hypothetical protein
VQPHPSCVRPSSPPPHPHTRRFRS